MENEAERYNFIQKLSGLNKSEFAATLGISKAYGYQIATGRAQAPRQSLKRLALDHHVNLNWYLYGQGDPTVSDEASIELIEQEAAAGHGREIEEFANRETLRVPSSLIRPYPAVKLQAVYVSGDSMTGTGIFDGDVVIFYPGLLQGNAIYVVSVDNSLLVKRVDFNLQNNEITLISANPAYEPRVFQGEELESIRIAGRVVAAYHRV